MKYFFTLPATLGVTLLLVCAPTTQAHTWVEELNVIAPNGTFIGAPGYARGYVPRNPDEATNAAMNYLLPLDSRSFFLPSDPLCKSNAKLGNQSPGFPILKASAGDQIALRYLENGHVTKPNTPLGKPKGSGTVFIYGTTKPSDSETYLGVHEWNAEGTGGDRRGVLLATRPFDDGQCYENNAEPISLDRQKRFPHTSVAPMDLNIWCQSDVQLPENVKGTYTLYWVWDWPTSDASGKIIVNESYTSCMDIDVSASNGGEKNKGEGFIQGQDLNFAAIKDQLANQFLVKPAPAPSPSDATTSTPAFSSAPTGNQKFQTVTVTQTPAMETVYITVTGDQLSSRSEPTTTRESTSLSTSTITVSPLPVISSASPSSPDLSSAASATLLPSSAPTGPPSVAPFLGDDTSLISQTPQPSPTTPTPRSITSLPTPPSSSSNGTVARAIRGRRLRF